MSSILQNWKTIRDRVAKYEKTPAGERRPATLVVVSKTQPVEALIPLLEAGQRDFGENRVQEALHKWPQLKTQYPDIRLHLIGPLQSNKIREALGLFNVIHTVDRKSLADSLVKESGRGAQKLCGQFFIQVNTGEEPQKAGVSPGDLPVLIQYISSLGSGALPVSGLMCIPPLGEPPAPHFALLRVLAERFGLAHLSMGMSGDYETALRLGATHVRVGSAIFGERAVL